MELTRFFLLPDSRLRAGWRLLLFFFFLAVSLAVFSLLASAVPLSDSLASHAALLGATTVSATWIMMRLSERLRFAAVGLTATRESWHQLRLGFLGGVGLMAAITLAEWAAGLVEFQPSEGGIGPAVAAMLSMTLILFVSAANEELLFRGYPFQRLAEGVHPYFALGATSLVFGWLHANNPHATGISIANTILAGVLLSLCYLRTRALWLPISFHFAWNWAQMLIGLPVSGLDISRLPWRAVSSSSDIWLHGGSYGPEGGVITTVLLAVSIVYLIQLRTKPIPLPKEPPTP